jgi:hypothetical protein
MGDLLFWLGIGAAQKGAGSKSIERRHWVASAAADDATMLAFRSNEIAPWLNGRRRFKRIGRELVCLRGSTPRSLNWDTIHRT